MPSIEKMLAYARSKHHQVTYSMTHPARLGPASMDCSSFVYYSLIAGGFLPTSHPIGNTETLFKLNGSVLTEIYDYNHLAPGDIFIRGGEGSSAGARGHTGIFTKKGEIIHCNALNNTVTINNELSFLRYFIDCKRSPNERYFRPVVHIQAQTTIHKKGRALVRAYTNVRQAPTTASPIVATYRPGQTIYYDQLIQTTTHKWLSYIGKDSGKRRYVAYSDYNSQWIDI